MPGQRVYGAWLRPTTVAMGLSGAEESIDVVVRYQAKVAECGKDRIRAYIGQVGHQTWGASSPSPRDIVTVEDLLRFARGPLFLPFGGLVSRSLIHSFIHSFIYSYVACHTQPTKLTPIISLYHLHSQGKATVKVKLLPRFIARTPVLY